MPIEFPEELVAYLLVSLSRAGLEQPFLTMAAHAKGRLSKDVIDKLLPQLGREDERQALMGLSEGFAATDAQVTARPVWDEAAIASVTELFKREIVNRGLRSEGQRPFVKANNMLLLDIRGNNPWKEFKEQEVGAHVLKDTMGHGWVFVPQKQEPNLTANDTSFGVLFPGGNFFASASALNDPIIARRLLTDHDSVVNPETNMPSPLIDVEYTPYVEVFSPARVALRPDGKVAVYQAGKISLGWGYKT